MATASLSASLRNDSGKGVARKLRAAGQVPAVIYGHGREPQSLAVNTREIERLLDTVAYKSTVIDLSIDGTAARTLIREVQRHPFKRQVLHVDFQELVAGETVVVRVPLVLVGTAEGVRNSGGILEQTMHEVEIECDPSIIPNHIDVDVSALGINKSFHVSDLTLPEGVTVLDDEEGTVCHVGAPKTSTETTAEPGAEAPAEPELIRKAKDDDEA